MSPVPPRYTVRGKGSASIRLASSRVIISSPQASASSPMLQIAPSGVSAATALTYEPALDPSISGSLS
jgi:hypothetical protein